MLTGKAWPDAAEILRKRYERVLKRVDQVTNEDVFEGLMNAYARAFDPHSSYFSPRSSEEYRIQMSPQLRGHLRFAPGGGRLRHHHERARRRTGGSSRHAQHQRPHHRRRPGT